MLQRHTVSSLAAALLPMAAVLLGFAIHIRGLLNNDVAWFMLAAHRMLEGGTYSKDLFEVNMPLAMIVYMPVWGLVRLTGLAQDQALVLWVSALIVQTVALIARILSRADAGTTPAPEWRARRSLLLVWLIGLLFIAPVYDFGQREHLITILALPYLFASALPAAFEKLGLRTRAYVCSLVAVGCLIKPHYAGLLAIRLAISMRRRGFVQTLRSVDFLCFAIIASVYLLVLVTVFPDWFNCARWAMDLYGAYESLHWDKLFGARGLAIATACFVVQTGLFVYLPELRRALLPFLVTAGYCFLIYFAQWKGWNYQFLPAELVAFAGQGTALLLLLSQRIGADDQSRKRLAISMVALVLLTTTAFVVHIERNRVTEMKLSGSFAQLPKQSVVYAFSFEVLDYFPAVQLYDMRWGSRYSPLWPLLGISVAEHENNSPHAADLVRTYRQPLINSVIEDFERYQPDAVFVDRRHWTRLPVNYDILGDFLATPRFVAIWRNYQRTGCALPDPDIGCAIELYRRLDTKTDPDRK